MFWFGAICKPGKANILGAMSAALSLEIQLPYLVVDRIALKVVFISDRHKYLRSFCRRYVVQLPVIFHKDQ